jgi:hypothetical protein
MMKPYSFQWQKLLLLIALVCISAIYLSIAFNTVKGRPVAPLDDAYITYQYARQIARGQLYRYNDGDPPTTGMTSLLFGFLLAGIYRLGFEGEQLAAIAVSLGVVWLSLITWLTYHLATHLIGPEGYGAWLSAGIVLLTGSVQWSCFNGMETGLFTVFVLAALDTFLSKKLGWCAFWLSCAALTRPEGLILTGLLWCIIIIEGLIRQHHIQCKSLYIFTVAVLVGLFPMAVNYILTSSISSAGLQAKSWTSNVPFDAVGIIWSVITNYNHILLERFMGKGWYVIPGLLLLAIWGWVRLAKERRWSALATTLSWFLIGTASTAMLITALWHQGRYQIPFIPITMIVSVYGLVQFREKVSPRWVNYCRSIVLLIVTALSLYTTATYINHYRRAISTVSRQQLVIADWLRENLPENAIVGIHDAGTLRYVGERDTYDLIGLTTPDAAIAWRHGSGSVYELMEHSPSRPTHFAIYPDVFSIPYLAYTDLFAEELFEVYVPDYAIASAGPVQGVWRADWHLADSGQYIVQPDMIDRTAGMALVDMLDVADLADESDHNVTWWQGNLIPGFPTELQQLSYRVLPEVEVLDGGRLLTGGITFDLTVHPGVDLWLVARLHAREAGAVQVHVNGIEGGRWAYPPVPGQWLETLFHIPAEVITGESTHIELEITHDVPNFRHFALYYLWAFQGEGYNEYTQGTQPVGAMFDEYFVLQGFDLVKYVWQAGDDLPITLYWLTNNSTSSEVKVFLHLYTADGKLVEQSDGWAYDGTRPPYTWQPGDSVADPRHISLPPDIAPGMYTLECGLYDDSGRLPAYVDGIRQSEERVILAFIEIQAGNP